jgi:hypothetical protein
MTTAFVVLIALTIASSVATVASVGKPRRPITPRQAAINVCVGALMVAVYVWLGWFA